jgi:hypothetical protein
VSEHWEAAVAQGVADLHDDYLIEESCDAMAIWGAPKEVTETVLTAAQPHLRRHILAELAADAKGESEKYGDAYKVHAAWMAARWLAAHLETYGPATTTYGNAAALIRRALEDR